MIRSRKEIEDMFSFLSWAADIRTRNINAKTTKTINNIYAAIQEVEEEEDETVSFWFKESERLKNENEILRKDLEQLSKFVYGKENKKTKNT
jgi:hypothetical protein